MSDPSIETPVGRRVGVYEVVSALDPGGMSESIARAIPNSDATLRSKSCHPPP
jgi:hypothetical protein